MVTIADQMRDEWRRVGRDEGRQEGRREGRDDGRRAALIDLGAAKWGSPPEKIAAKIALASGEQLVVWTLRVLTAGSWAELVA